MTEHPIEGLMGTTMESIKEMVDVNTIVGDAVETPDGTVIIPISKVSFGFAAGGSEFKGSFKDLKESKENEATRLPFGGGSGAGVSINPVAFMVVGQGQIKLLPIDSNSSLDKVLDLVPNLIEKVNESIRKKISVKKKAEKTESGSNTTTEIENE